MSNRFVCPFIYGSTSNNSPEYTVHILHTTTTKCGMYYVRVYTCLSIYLSFFFFFVSKARQKCTSVVASWKKNPENKRELRSEPWKRERAYYILYTYYTFYFHFLRTYVRTDAHIPSIFGVCAFVARGKAESSSRSVCIERKERTREKE